TVEVMSQEVFGLSCKQALVEHRSAVTCMAAVTNYYFKQANRYMNMLITSGWDRRICVWDLDTGALIDVAKDVHRLQWNEREHMANDVILDLVYSPERNEIGYVSADWYLYLRTFHLDGRKIQLKQKLQGHHGEVNCLAWRPPLHEISTAMYATDPSPFDLFGAWITGSVDGTIRVWVLFLPLPQCIIPEFGSPVCCQ
ncbi:hypothetical protein Ciccas_012124, partial [Cichlidogyrus casuarinus]